MSALLLALLAAALTAGASPWIVSAALGGADWLSRALDRLIYLPERSDD